MTATSNILRRMAVALLGAALCFSAAAAIIEQPLQDPTQEQTARTIFHDLRCVVCEGQSLAESDAPLAGQMRAHVRSLVAEGKSPDEIRDFFRARYGEQILMRPPVGGRTALLWLAPLLLLLIGGGLIWRTTTHQAKDIS